MKVTEHIEHLLRQGRKPKELVELGFPKQVITRVRRQLKVEKTASQMRTQEGKVQAVVARPAETELVKPTPGALETKVQQLESRAEALESLGAELEDLETRIDGTPALGLKHCFKCDCGVSGFVAVRIKCTKCGRETYRGWWPEKE